MARRKKASQRPTLEEIKAQEGKYVVALLGFPIEGEKVIGMAGTTKDLVDGAPADAIRSSVLLSLFDPKIVNESWLDDVGFQRLYDKCSGLLVFRADDAPDPIDKSFPDRLDTVLSDTNKQTILRLCFTPYWNYDENDTRGGRAEIDAVIAMDRQTEGIGERVTQADIRDFRVKVLIPFLTGWREMEKRFQNRKPIIDKINARLRAIEAERQQDLPAWLSQSSAR